MSAVQLLMSHVLCRQPVASSHSQSHTFTKHNTDRPIFLCRRITLHNEAPFHIAFSSSITQHYRARA